MKKRSIVLIAVALSLFSCKKLKESTPAYFFVSNGTEGPYSFVLNDSDLGATNSIDSIPNLCDERNLQGFLRTEFEIKRNTYVLKNNEGTVVGAYDLKIDRNGSGWSGGSDNSQGSNLIYSNGDYFVIGVDLRDTNLFFGGDCELRGFE